MTQTPSSPLATLLAQAAGQRRRWLWLTPLLLLLAVAGFWLLKPRPAVGPVYQTEVARRGDLTVTVSATGTLAPTHEVEVGSELSGIVEAVYVDVNDRVKKGQVLARLDTAKLKDAVAKSQAALAVAEAQVLQSRATTAEMAANLARLRRVAELSGGKVPAQADLDAAEASLHRAEASDASAQAQVTQARAALRSDETSLAKASILSPIDGVVLSRKVDPGQTVAAAMTAPVLFQLAEDLARMELRVNVDEADVGRVKAGQTARFSVDAWPNRHYDARITRVSYGAQSTDEVVSYQTTLQVDNPDLSLRPGMTATALITTLERKDVLLIPNAALRFTPPEPTAPKPSGGLLSAMLPRPPMPSASPRPAAKLEGRQRIWVLRDGRAAPLDISVGPGNGQYTEVTGGELAPDMAVIVDSQDGGQ